MQVKYHILVSYGNTLVTVTLVSGGRYKVGVLCILFYDGIEIISRMCLPNKYISVTVSVKAFCLTTLTI